MAEQPVLVVRNLVKEFGGRRGKLPATAVRDVSLELAGGRFLAVVGPSGSGKSTLARCIARLEDSDEGDIWFRDRALTQLSKKELRPFRSQMQLILQDAAGALNPRFTALQAVEEPLVVQRSAKRDERRRRTLELMQQVGLAAEWADRRVPQFSGGQRQRLAIARALMLRPSFLILDEALSGLDLSTQAQVVNLLLDLREAHGLTYLVISHDLALVAEFADEIAVMHAGQVVERGTPAAIMDKPQHPQTAALVNAAVAMRGETRALAAEGAQ